MNKGGMNISVWGLWYVWLPTVASMVLAGHNVVGFDPDENKIAQLNDWKIYMEDEWLSGIIQKWLSDWNLSFTSNSEEWVNHWDSIICAVWTPIWEDGRYVMDYIDSVVDSVINALNNSEWKKTLIMKSTVTTGTGSWLIERVQNALEWRVSSNDTEPFDLKDIFEYISFPEFLEEWKWIEWSLNPDRMVFWVQSDFWKQLMQGMFSHIDWPKIFTDIKTAEFTKIIANAVLSVRVSMINEIANLAEVVWVNMFDVVEWIKNDPRIGQYFLKYGAGFWWACFPKDLLALLQQWFTESQRLKILFAAEEVNTAQKIRVVKKLKVIIPDLKNKKIALWWLSFKPGTANVTQSPSIDVIHELSNEGVEAINSFDPLANDSMKSILWKNDPVKYFDGMYETLEWADALIIMSDGSIFKEASIEKIQNIMWNNAVVIDGRSCLDHKEARWKGLRYECIWLPPLGFDTL